MLKVDVLQVFISTAAVFGMGLLWINFNEKVFKTVRNLVAAPFKSSEPERPACEEAINRKAKEERRKAKKERRKAKEERRKAKEQDIEEGIEDEDEWPEESIEDEVINRMALH